MFVVLRGQVADQPARRLRPAAAARRAGAGAVPRRGRARSRGGRRWSTDIAEGEVEAILIPPAGLRALLVAEAELGERITRALILRRVALIQAGHGGPLIIGAAGQCRRAAARDLPSPQRPSAQRARPGHRSRRRRGCSATARAARTLPLVVTARRARCCTTRRSATSARALGLTGRAPARGALRRRGGRRRAGRAVGGGLCGLGRAVGRGARRRGYGGQAGASARIENYLGFPTGITGQALTGRAFVQAREVRRRDHHPRAVDELDCLDPAAPFRLELSDGGACARARWSIASGARYRRPAMPGIAALRGARRLVLGLADRGAALRRHRGGAGRRRQFGRAGGGVPVRASRRVNLLIRGPDLNRNMSRYLVERIEATPNIELFTETEIVDARRRPGRRTSQRLTWSCRQTGGARDAADPQPLPVHRRRPGDRVGAACELTLDGPGFVLTGAAVPAPAGQAAA